MFEISNKTSLFSLVSLLTILLVGVSCGPSSQFSRARDLEKKGEFYKAWERYQEFVARYPKHELAAEALFRAGWVAQKGLKDCYVASMFYEKVLVQYPQSEPWARAAVLQPMNCPDYFPLIVGSWWEEGDSDSKGHFSRTKIECESLKLHKDTLPSQAGRLTRTYYAGNKKFKDTNFIYEKKNGTLVEYVSENDSRAKVIFKWPLEVGTTWRTRMGGRFFHYEIVSDGETVEVQAGRFENCLKLRLRIEGGIGSNYEYYAPGVGRVLTTLATKSGEKRNIELLKFKIADFPEFKKVEKEG